MNYNGLCTKFVDIGEIVICSSGQLVNLIVFTGRKRGKPVLWVEKSIMTFVAIDGVRWYDFPLWPL